MEENEIQEKIIGLPETILMTLLVGVEELAEFAILVFTLGLGIIVVEVMNGAVGGVLEMYMALRGGKGIVKWIVQPIGAFINGISGCLLPGKTVAMLTGIWVINHPAMLAKITNIVGRATGQAVQNITTTIRGGVSEIGGGVSGAAEAIAGKTVEPGVSAARQRMTMATGTTSGKIIGADRMVQAREVRNQQNMQKDVSEDIQMKEAA